MRKIYYYFFLLAVLVLSYSCSENNSGENFESNQTGFLSTPNLLLNVEEGNFSRDSELRPRATRDSDINQFVIEILEYPSLNIYQSWENYSEVLQLEKVELPAGNYLLKTFNDRFPVSSPSFDFPYFLGQSAVFSIEYEETTNIGDVLISPKNTQLSVEFSEEMVNQFDTYQLRATTSENNQSLLFDEVEARSGYFSSGYDITLEGTFTFIRTDGTSDVRAVSHVIPNAGEGTHYKVEVNVTLQNGELIFNFTLDDSYSEEVVSLGNGDSQPSFVPKQEPVITSNLNGFYENSLTVYTLTWETIPEATYYTVYKGTTKYNMTELISNLNVESLDIELLEGPNFFRVEAHFDDGEVTSYLGSNFRRKNDNPNFLYSYVANELTPVNGLVYNYQNNEVDGQNMTFQANVDTGGLFKIHINGDGGGDYVNYDGGSINEEIDLQDGGIGYYYYSGSFSGVRRNDNHQYFILVTDPVESFSLAQEYSPLAVRINLSNYSWSMGVPFYYLERREVGTTSWQVVGDGWSTSEERYDYDISVGKSYEYRFKVSASNDFVKDSRYSPIETITIN